MCMEPYDNGKLKTMKNQWREYKEWLDKFIPDKVSKYLWYSNFEKAILMFLVIGLLYLIGFVVFGRELFEKLGQVIN